MKKYKIEHKILTLAHCAVMEVKEKPASFEIEGLEFSHWDFNFRDGWKDSDAWIATAEIEAENFIDAINVFRAKLNKLIPRISLICQSYIEFTREPFIVHDLSRDIAFFEYSQDVKSGGLMFMEKERDALIELLKHEEIPEPFYHYWNDAVNASGYSAKLLLMFSAMEAMARKRNKSVFKKPIDLYTKILGEDLATEIFSDEDGLRNRLVHGEYFNGDDSGKNYLDTVHKKVIAYFNKEVFSKPYIQEDVVSPQRHPFGTKQGGRCIVKRKDAAKSFPLKDLLDDFDEHGFGTPERYEHVFDNSLAQSY